MTAPEDSSVPCHEISLRVSYGDTDKAGVVYYANYFRYFERGRTELLRSKGVSYRDLEIDHGIVMPVIEANCRYLAPCRYDDLVVVRSWISALESASLSVRNDVFIQEGNDRSKVAEGFTRHAVLNSLWRPTRIPEDIRRRLES